MLEKQNALGNDCFLFEPSEEDASRELSWVDAWMVTRVNSIKEYLDETNQPVSFINSLRRHLISSQTVLFCLYIRYWGLRNVNCNAVSRSFKNP